MGKATPSKAGSKGTGKSSKKKADVIPSAVVSYRLSDPTFIRLKWTKLPSVLHTVNSLPTKPWSCFKKRETEKYLFYPKGQLAAKFNTNGAGKIYYISGATAIEATQSILGHQYVLIYSDKTDENESKCLGWLDSFGNCLLVDAHGKVITNYNQTGGVFYNKDDFWKWRWNQLLPKRKRSAESIYFPTRKSKMTRDNTTERAISDDLLELHIKSSPNKHTLKLAEGKIYFQCKISECMSLWITSQDKIDLSFASNSFITRLDVGITVVSNTDVDTKSVPETLQSPHNMNDNKKIGSVNKTAPLSPLKPPGSASLSGKESKKTKK